MVWFLILLYLIVIVGFWVIYQSFVILAAKVNQHTNEVSELKRQLRAFH